MLFSIILVAISGGRADRHVNIPHFGTSFLFMHMHMARQDESCTILEYLPLFNYVVDTYLFVAASALATLAVVRSLFGAAFPVSTDTHTLFLTTYNTFIHVNPALRHPDVREVEPTMGIYSSRFPCNGNDSYTFSPYSVRTVVQQHLRLFCYYSEPL